MDTTKKMIDWSDESFWKSQIYRWSDEIKKLEEKQKELKQTILLVTKAFIKQKD